MGASSCGDLGLGAVVVEEVAAFEPLAGVQRRLEVVERRGPRLVVGVELVVDDDEVLGGSAGRQGCRGG
jgi:hypothetical protein